MVENSTEGDGGSKCVLLLSLKLRQIKCDVLGAVQRW